MARNTSIDLRNLNIYQVFVRQFSKTHDFKGVIKKLDHIKSQNYDLIYLLPIHPIGKERRKGSVGSPYSISNYYEVNPDYGTMDDFKRLLSEVHQRDMKLMIDIVFNHTSHDADYTKTNPEWYYRKEDGSFSNRVGDWWDIIDFKFEDNLELEDELINVLMHWAKLGVDGFRCDVAPLLPLDFWVKARNMLNTINPNLIYLSESVHLGFIKYLRDLGYEAYSDSEIYQAFDICYDYDIFDDFINYFKQGESIQKWIDNLIKQEGAYPSNYVKLRFLENHDQERIAKYIKNPSQLRSVSALLYFLKGATMIYNGQECGATKRPDLFEIDEISWDTYNYASIADIFKKMSKLKKDLEYLNGVMNIELLNNHVLEFRYELPDKLVIGIFNISPNKQKVIIKYQGIDYLSNRAISEGMQKIEEPIVLIIKK